MSLVFCGGASNEVSDDVDKSALAIPFILPLLALEISDTGLLSETPIRRCTLRILAEDAGV